MGGGGAPAALESCCSKCCQAALSVVVEALLPLVDLFRSSGLSRFASSIVQRVDGVPLDEPATTRIVPSRVVRDSEGQLVSAGEVVQLIDFFVQ